MCVQGHVCFPEQLSPCSEGIVCVERKESLPEDVWELEFPYWIKFSDDVRMGVPA